MTESYAIPLLLMLVLGSLVAPPQGQDDAKLIEGTWLPSSGQLAGQALPEESLMMMKLVMKGEKYTVHVGDQLDQGTVKIDFKANPKTMNITGTDGPNKGKTFLAIYEVSQDTMKVCYDLSGKARPTEFKTAIDTQLFLVTYKRDKR